MKKLFWMTLFCLPALACNNDFKVGEHTVGERKIASIEEIQNELQVQAEPQKRAAKLVIETLDGKEIICSATILSPTVFITQVGCMKNAKEWTITPRFGTTQQGRTFEGGRANRHNAPLYNLDERDYMIVELRMGQKFKGITPIKILPKKLENGEIISSMIDGNREYEELPDDFDIFTDELDLSKEPYTEEEEKIRAKVDQVVVSYEYRHHDGNKMKTQSIPHRNLNDSSFEAASRFEHRPGGEGAGYWVTINATDDEPVWYYSGMVVGWKYHDPKKRKTWVQELGQSLNAYILQTKRFKGDLERSLNGNFRNNIWSPELAQGK